MKQIYVVKKQNSKKLVAFTSESAAQQFIKDQEDPDKYKIICTDLYQEYHPQTEVDISRALQGIKRFLEIRYGNDIDFIKDNSWAVVHDDEDDCLAFIYLDIVDGRGRSDINDINTHPHWFRRNFEEVSIEYLQTHDIGEASLRGDYLVMVIVKEDRGFVKYHMGVTN